MKKRHWFNFVEDFSLLGLGAGLSLSFVTKQILYTSAPISFALLIGLLNRRRIEQAQDQKISDSIASLDQKLSKNLKVIDQQIQNMPTPEMVGDVRQSILRHTREKMKKTYAYINNVKRDVENRLNVLDQQNIGEAREDITQLQLQYAELYNSLNGVTLSLRNMVTNERAEEIDQSIAKVTESTTQIETTVKTLNEFSNHTLTNLQDQVNQLSRQLKALPPQVDASSIKREVGELVRVVADLVPKRDLNALVTDLRIVQQQQTNQIQAGESLRRDVQKVNKRLQALPDVPQLRSQLEESFTREIRAINRQLRTLYHSPELKSTIEEVLRSEVEHLQAMIAERSPSLPYDLVFDLSANTDSEADPIMPGSRKALSDALESTQERLILIWPWSSHTELNGDLLRQFEGFLKQQRQLDIGWCHVSDRLGDRFLSVINRRWSINPLSQGALQGTLKRLLAIKRYYPNNFQFKILGTAENYLISDESFAVLGLDARLRTQTFLQDAELKLRTTDEQVIQHLIQRFDEVDPPVHDIESYWNRAVTRYDLGDKAGAIADLDTILSSTSDDPAVYNLRGIIRYEQKNIELALEDLTQSINLNPNQCSAYCNRGYLQSEKGDQYGAIADFSLAIQSNPESAIAFFYRGAASQKLEDYDGAIADYTEALANAPEAPVVLYQRAMVYRTMGHYAEAIADLEQAAHLFAAQGSNVNAQKAHETLAKVQQAHDISHAEHSDSSSDILLNASSIDTQPRLDMAETEQVIYEEQRHQAQGHEEQIDSEQDNAEQIWIEERLTEQSLEAVVSEPDENGIELNPTFMEPTIANSDDALFEHAMDFELTPNIPPENILNSDETVTLKEGYLSDESDDTFSSDDSEVDDSEVDDSIDLFGNLGKAETDEQTSDLLAFEDPEFKNSEFEDFAFDTSTPHHELLTNEVDNTFNAEDARLADLETFEPDEFESSVPNIETLNSELSEFERADSAFDRYSELSEFERADSAFDRFTAMELFEDVESETNTHRDYEADSPLDFVDHSVDSIVWEHGDNTEFEAERDVFLNHQDVHDHQDVHIDPESTFTQGQNTPIDPESTFTQEQNASIDPESTFTQEQNAPIDPEGTYTQEFGALQSTELVPDITDQSIESIAWYMHEAENADDIPELNRADASDDIHLMNDLSGMDEIESFRTAEAVDHLEMIDDAEAIASGLPNELDAPAMQDNSNTVIYLGPPEDVNAPDSSHALTNELDELFDVWDEATTSNPITSHPEIQPSTPLNDPEEQPSIEQAINSENWDSFFANFGITKTPSPDVKETTSLPNEALTSPNQDSDAQQIGTQTLRDFYSVINNEVEVNDSSLLSEQDILRLPKENGQLTPSNSPELATGASQPSHDRLENGASEQLRHQNDLFLGFPEKNNVVTETENGHGLPPSDSANKPNDEKSESSDKVFAQVVDDDSLADFCKRFTI